MSVQFTSETVRKEEKRKRFTAEDAEDAQRT